MASSLMQAADGPLSTGDHNINPIPVPVKQRSSGRPTRSSYPFLFIALALLLAVGAISAVYLHDVLNEHKERIAPYGVLNEITFKY